MNEAQQIKQFFNKASKTYDECSQLQQRIGEKLITLIQQQHSHTNRIIDLGCGTGMVTKKLACTLAHQELLILDIANELLKKANEHLSAFRFQTHEADFNAIANIEPSFNLIFSNMALQWSSNLSDTLHAMSNKLDAQGIIAFSIPLSGTLTELKYNYDLNNFFSAESIRQKLAILNLNVITHDVEKITLPFDNLFSALKSIKNVGANYTGKPLHKGLRGKSFLYTRMLQQLTYVIGYFIVKKKE